MTKKSYLTFIITSLLFLPIAIPIISIGDKPIDLVPSDILLFLGMFLFFIDSLLNRNKLYISKSVKLISFFILLNFAYGLMIIIPYSEGDGSDFIQIASYLKFYKSMLLFYIGVYFANKISFRKSFLEYSGITVSLIILIIFLSTLLDERFPVMLWGEKFFTLTIYGFPNTGMAFVALITLFILGKYYISKQKIYIFIYILGAVLIIFSLSRSSFLVLFFGTILLSFKMINIQKMLRMSIILIVVSSTILMLLNGNKNVEKIVNLVQYRIDRSIGNTDHDPSSGRFEIWKEALKIISEKPIFGYGFDSFSNRKVGHGTPHQQYLEIIYKMGLLGFILYMSTIFYTSFYIFMRFKRITYQPYIVIKNIYLAGLIAIMISNFTQPNLSFSLTGNLLFFIMGFLMTIVDIPYSKRLKN